MRCNIGQIRQAISPSNFFNIRIGQVLLAIVYLSLLCYCGVHPGWWLNLQKPLGFGISASLLTILIATPDILRRDFTLSPYLAHFLRVSCEFFLIGFWVAAFVTMVRPKGKEFRLLFHKPPYVQWDLAAVLAVIEFLTFLWSMALTMQGKYLIRDNNGL